MTRWTWIYQLTGDDGKMLSRLTAYHEHEQVDEVQHHFREFLRGCGYAVSDEEQPDVEELEERIQAVVHYIHESWSSKPETLHEFREDLTNIMALLDGRTE